ncbi:site-specific integrase [Streptomyces sp. NPDC001876]|uniref:site-specific integrase n=1 Tax=Streptomyces sp. NPDC001876 TaxID=3154402 RepID=UPI00331CA0D4
MTSSRRAGGISKRCECRGSGGKRLGAACPLLSKRAHGKHRVSQELPPTAEGKRRQFQRTGYATATDAQKDLSRIQALLDLAPDDDEAQCRIGDLLAELMGTRGPIPEPADVTRRIGAGVPLNGSTTVGDWLDSWVAKKKSSKKRKTATGYESHVRVHLKPAVGHVRMDRFNVGHAQGMFDAIDEANETILAENQARREQIARCTRGKPGAPKASERAQLEAERAKLAEMSPFRKVTGPATKQRIRSTLRAALNAAISAQLITFNAASHVELAPARRPKGLLWTDERVARWRETGQKPSAVMVWTPAQLGAFLDAAEGERLYAFFHLVAHHGLRRGEGVGLDWANVEAKKITVAKEIVVDGWTPVEEDPKTDGSAAAVMIDRGTARVLAAHRVQQLAERDARLVAGQTWTDTGKVFTQEDGAWLHPDTVSKTFRRIADAAGLPPINLRDCRHGAAALVKAGGGDLHDAKVKLRHSTIVLTSDTYMELFEEYEDALTEKAAAVVPRARKPEEPADSPA